MADNSHSRPYRAPEQPVRGGGPVSQPQGDPLAELARLIGQNDSYSNFAQGQSGQHGVQHPAQPPRGAAAEWQQPHDPRGHAPETYRGAQEMPRGDYGAPAQYAPPAQDHYYETQNYGAHRHDGGGRADPAGYGAQAYGDQYGYQQGAADPFAGPQPSPAYGQPDDYGYGSNAYQRMPHDPDMYEDSAPARRRGGMLTVMAVLALAVLGTAGAFAYRAVFSDSGPRLAPPVIKADTTPSKVAPTTTTQTASGKQIYDRVGDRNQQERVVSREETPVDMAQSPPPRVVLSTAGQNPVAPAPAQAVTAPAFASSATAAPAASSSGTASTEPKKVRTLTIRPDQPETAPTSRTAQTTSADHQSAPTPTRGAPTTRAVTASSDPNAPLSLVPQPTSTRSAPARVASVPQQTASATPGGGAYSVQVTSQRSEAEAQTAYRALQAKYPGVLADRQVMIRRADLGEKGIYYRAQVGPFGSSDQASEFCGNLKAAGGQCVVQRN